MPRRNRPALAAGMTRRKVCTACRGKTCYDSQPLALAAMNYQRGHVRRDRLGTDGEVVPQRAYRCPVGNGWHLTKQDPVT